MKPIGKIIHYYGKPGVGIVRLEDTLKVGDRIRIERGDQSFDQEVVSMQKDYKEIDQAEKGDEVGVKFSEKVHEGAMIIRLEEGE